MTDKYVKFAESKAHPWVMKALKRVSGKLDALDIDELYATFGLVHSGSAMENSEALKNAFEVAAEALGNDHKTNR